MVVQFFKAPLFLDSARNNHAHGHFEGSRDSEEGIGIDYCETLIVIINKNE